jgi:xanthine dehydrogenase accessory factor
MRYQERSWGSAAIRQRRSCATGDMRILLMCEAREEGRADPSGGAVCRVLSLGYGAMRDVLPDLLAFRGRGERVGRAVLTGIVGSAPRPEGASLIVSDRGSMAGSVSGGCIEGAVFSEIQDAIAAGRPTLLSYGVSDETAWSVGLACGGTFEILVQPDVPADVERAASGETGAVVATVLRGPDGAADEARTAIAEAAARALDAEASATVTIPVGGGVLEVFLEVFPPRPRLIVFGGVHVAVALVRLARELGYRTIVADGRAAFANRERFPDADEILVAWPEEAFARVGLDHASYVAVLTHDPKFDEPALAIALRSDARYVGAIGSRRTQAARRDRLLARGVSEAELGRLRGPIGLDLGGRGAAEIALAILAEMTAVRYGASGRPMMEAGRREKALTPA